MFLALPLALCQTSVVKLDSLILSDLFVVYRDLRRTFFFYFLWSHLPVVSLRQFTSVFGGGISLDCQLFVYLYVFVLLFLTFAALCLYPEGHR